MDKEFSIVFGRSFHNNESHICFYDDSKHEDINYDTSAVDYSPNFCVIELCGHSLNPKHLPFEGLSLSRNEMMGLIKSLESLLNAQESLARTYRIKSEGDN